MRWRQLTLDFDPGGRHAGTPHQEWEARGGLEGGCLLQPPSFVYKLIVFFEKKWRHADCVGRVCGSSL